MDPVSAAGLALGVAGVGVQVFQGCVQGIQLLITAANFPDDCKYLNLRLRMEQQRLFAWSETSGLMDLDAANNPAKVLASNTFVLHRTTVLDLLVQVQCLFDEFRRYAEANQLLNPAPPAGPDDDDPGKDAAAANFPLPARRRDFIRKAMRGLREKSREGALRLRWVAFDQSGFEALLARFSTLNDNMTDILDASMQVEIHHAVQDTNRGVLQLHHRISDLSRLVQALNVKLELGEVAVGGRVGVQSTPLSETQKRSNASGLLLLSQLAKFKAFNQSMDGDSKAWDAAAAVRLGLEKPCQQKNLQLDRLMIKLDPETSDAPRCEALLEVPGGDPRKCWIEWKDYEAQRPGNISPPKEVILERVRKLAALLNHSPKPDAFRTPHCLGYFDKASSSKLPQDQDDDDDDDNDDEEEEDILNNRLGLVFSRPPNTHATLPPVSLHTLLTTARKPRLTDRITLAHAVAHCLLYLHAVNWLHKGLRSHNILFFQTDDEQIPYDKPYLSGFDFSRPAPADEMTQVPADVENDMYRHPAAQASTQPGARERFKRAFDVYSLGVLFVEIAYWKPVDRILEIDLRAAQRSRRAALAVRGRLLGEDVAAEVGASMGSRFEEATRACLEGTGGDEELGGEVVAREAMGFYEEVVQKLGDIRV